MGNPIITSLFVTLIGMGAVFLAMALIYVSMHLLTILVRDRPKEVTGTKEKDRLPPPAQDPGQGEKRVVRLRAAAVGIALARADRDDNQAPGPSTLSGESTPWGEYYRHRQLSPGGRGRSA